MWSGAALHNGASSLHLPPSIDKPVVDSISETYISLTTFALVVSALSLGALLCTLLRGMYIAPTCANTDYKKDAAAALAAGKRCSFQTKKFFRSLCYDVTSVLALVGVLLLLLVASINYGVLVKVSQSEDLTSFSSHAAILSVRPLSTWLQPPIWPLCVSSLIVRLCLPVPNAFTKL